MKNFLKTNVIRTFNNNFKRTFANTITGKEEKPAMKTGGGYGNVSGTQLPNKSGTDSFQTPDYDRGHEGQAPRPSGQAIPDANKKDEVIINKDTKTQYANTNTKANEGNAKVEAIPTETSETNKVQERKTGAQKSNKIEKNDAPVKDFPHGNPKI